MEDIKINEKQKAFCNYYIETLNAFESAIRAGYSKNYAKAQSYKMLENVGIKSYIDKKLKELEDQRIAKADEVLKHLTSMMRGEITEEVVVTENIGDFMSEARKIDKQVSAKERIRAAELLGRRYSLFIDKVDVNVEKSEKLSDIIDQLGGEGLEE